MNLFNKKQIEKSIEPEEYQINFIPLEDNIIAIIEVRGQLTSELIVSIKKINHDDSLSDKMHTTVQLTAELLTLTVEQLCKNIWIQFKESEDLNKRKEVWLKKAFKESDTMMVRQYRKYGDLHII